LLLVLGAFAPDRVARMRDAFLTAEAAIKLRAMFLLENELPTAAELSEQAWIADIVSATGCGLVLDLHNLHANATNFGFDPLQFLSEISLDRVGCIHIAGGQWITSPDGDKRYVLDDHLHEVTDWFAPSACEAGT
jgi:uncharacterized protein (UPF0276 family)